METLLILTSSFFSPSLSQPRNKKKREREIPTKTNLLIIFSSFSIMIRFWKHTHLPIECIVIRLKAAIDGFDKNLSYHAKACNSLLEAPQGSFFISGHPSITNLESGVNRYEPFPRWTRSTI